MSSNSSKSNAGQSQTKYGFGIVVIGLILVGFIFGIAVLRWTSASDVSTVVSAATGVIGTLVGAFFGVQLGSAGKDKSDAARQTAENKALHFAAALEPSKAQQVMEKLDSMN